MSTSDNIDAAEVSKFEEIAHRWWDPNGSFKPLHDINPIRADFVDERVHLAGKRVLDVGCGGGLLSEEMARRGALVTGIDAGETVIRVARAHQMESDVQVEYLQMSAESLAASKPAQFDVVTCLELIEHVPDPQSLVRACSTLVDTGGEVFFSTINRNLKAWLLAIVGAEYMLGLLPRGTHDYQKLVKPSELTAWARQEDLQLKELSGMRYNPFSGAVRLCDDVDVNYLAWMQRR